MSDGRFKAAFEQVLEVVENSPFISIRQEYKSPKIYHPVEGTWLPKLQNAKDNNNLAKACERRAENMKRKCQP
jgi:hypothetical protein